MAHATYTVPQSDLPGERWSRSRAFAQAALTVSDATTRQWPLAPPAVILSASLIAYYGHIRVSGLPHRLMAYARRVLEHQRFPNLLREPVGFVSFPVPRRFPRLHWTVASS